MRRILILLPVLLSACGTGKKEGIALSNVPLYSVALDLCDGCRYHVIVRGMGHMHSYEPSPKDQVVATSACAFVRIKGLDGWARGWKGTVITTPDPHFWLFGDGVETVAESLDAVLRRCEPERYSSENLQRFNRTVDSLFSVRIGKRACASSVLVHRFLSEFGVEVPCVLRSDEFREPSPSEVQEFMKRVREVGVVVKDTSDALPSLPEGVRLITLNLHPVYGEKYTEFLRRNVEKLLRDLIEPD